MKIRIVSKTFHTRDCTVGKIYDAEHLQMGALDHAGFEVDVNDGYQFTDDVGDSVSVILSKGSVELVEE